jgi:hypothetical protein
MHKKVADHLQGLKNKDQFLFVGFVDGRNSVGLERKSGQVHMQKETNGTVAGTLRSQW